MWRLDEHVHTPLFRSDDRCYFGCVAGDHCEPAAHGNIEYTEYCSCGAWRRVNENRFCREYGPWHAPRRTLPPAAQVEMADLEGWAP